MDTMTLVSQIFFPFCIITIMFALGTTLEGGDFKRVISRPKPVFLGLVGQMVLLPATAFLFTLVVPMDPSVAIGLIILSACPGGVTSNAIVFVARADLALSVTLTALSSTLTTVTVPLIVSAGLRLHAGAGQDFSMPVLDTMIRLFLITILPMSIGMSLKRWAPAIEAAFFDAGSGYDDPSVSGFTILPMSIGMSLKRWAPAIEAAWRRSLRMFTLIIMIAMVSVGTLTSVDFLASNFLGMVVATLGLAAITMSMGYLLARAFRLNKEQGVTISIEVGVQNVAVAIVVAATILGRRELAVTPGIYGVIMYLVVTAFLMSVRKRQRL